MFYSLVVYVLTLFKTELAVKDALANKLFFNPVKDTEDWIAVLSGIIYWILGYRLIMRYRHWLFDTQSDSRFEELSWLKNLVLISGLLVLGITLVVFLEDLIGAGKNHFWHLQLFYAYLAVITYYLSFKGYQLYHAPKAFEVAGIKTENTNFIDSPVLPETIVVKPDIDFKPIRDLIIHALENGQLYLNAELTIKQLAQHINCPVATVSATINHCFGMNFRNLINSYRVTEVKKRFVDPPAHLSIMGVALDCGFNSEASFYRIFRQQTGQSPNDYIKSHKK